MKTYLVSTQYRCASNECFQHKCFWRNKKNTNIILSKKTTTTKSSLVTEVVLVLGINIALDKMIFNPVILIFFLISPRKHMLWVPITYVFMEKLEKYDQGDYYPATACSKNGFGNSYKGMGFVLFVGWGGIYSFKLVIKRWMPFIIKSENCCNKIAEHPFPLRINS